MVFTDAPVVARRAVGGGLPSARQGALHRTCVALWMPSCGDARTAPSGRAVPAELEPWWIAAQTFIRWARLGVWDRLHEMAKAKGAGLGLLFL